MLGTEPQQCGEEEEEGGQEVGQVPVSREHKEWCQNGDGGHEAAFEEGDIKPEDEHHSNGSADSPSEGQQ